MGSGKDNDDDLLIRQCLAGNERAWTTFYYRYSPLVRNIVRRQKGFSPQDVEDVTQNVFVDLMQGLSTYDPAYSLPRFICMVAERVCIDEYRKAKAAKRDAPTDPIDHHDGAEDGVKVVASNAQCQEEELAEAQLVDILRRALKKLGSDCQKLLRLRYYEEMPYKEITQILDATENTLTVQARRCIDELRAIWDELVRKGIER